MKAKSGAAPRPSFPQVLAGIHGLFPGGGPHFPLCPIPDILNPPSVHGVARLLVLRLCHSRRFQSGIHGLFPRGGHTNERTEEKDTGFPLKTGGNDRGGGENEGEERVGMTRGGE